MVESNSINLDTKPEPSTPREETREELLARIAMLERANTTLQQENTELKDKIQKLSIRTFRLMLKSPRYLPRPHGVTDHVVSLVVGNMCGDPLPKIVGLFITDKMMKLIKRGEFKVGLPLTQYLSADVGCRKVISKIVRKLIELLCDKSLDVVYSSLPTRLGFRY